MGDHGIGEIFSSANVKEYVVLMCKKRGANRVADLVGCTFNGASLWNEPALGGTSYLVLICTLPGFGRSGAARERSGTGVFSEKRPRGLGILIWCLFAAAGHRPDGFQERQDR
jgi:hypothetical protein